MNEVFELTQENLEKHNHELKEEYSVTNNKDNNKSEKRTNSTCSSRTSHTSTGEEEEEDDNEEESSLESCENSQMSDYSSLSEENVYALIKNFPVQIICLEKMDNTLDSLLDDEEDGNKISNKEWASCLFQIIMILITYQKNI